MPGTRGGAAVLGGVLFSSLGSLLIALALAHVWSAASRPAVCETTYIYEGYEGINLPAQVALAGPSYKLIQWADGDPAQREGTAALRSRRPVLPLLFVHGHLGSHQQMRSLASETAREAVRRWKAGDAGAAWVQWYAVDFNAEPSALEPRLAAQQATFVAACLRHLLHLHPGQRLVAVGHSMGGVVLQAALDQLELDPGAHSAHSVALVVTLGSPIHHLPSLLPPVAASLQPSCTLDHADSALSSSVLETACAAALLQPPTLRVLAGPGDILVPALSAWRHAAGAGSHKAHREVRVDLEDVPGAWCTASHSSLVSCNQLVRRVVPLLVDVAAVPPGGNVVGVDDAVLRTLRQRMTTMLERAMPASMEQAEAAAAEVEGAACTMAGGDDAEVEDVAEPLVITPLPSGSALRLRWRAAKHSMHSGALTLLVAGGQPCRHFQVRGTKGDGADLDLTHLAAALPPLLPRFQGHTAPRFWREVMDGVDWMRNATWLLHLPLGIDESSFASVEVKLPSGDGHQPQSGALLAQTTEASVHSVPPATLPWPRRGAVNQLQGHHALVSLLPASWGFQSRWAALAARLLVGAHPPWRLVVTRGECDADLGQEQQLLTPAFVALGGSVDTSDVVRVDPGSGSRGAQGLALWLPGVAGRQVLAVLDPRCSWQISTRWDLGAWAAYTVRYHALSLPALTLALCMLRLGGCGGHATALFALLSAQAAAVGAAWPQLTQHLISIVPWLPLSAIEALALLAAATALRSAVAGAAQLWVRSLGRALLPAVGWVSIHSAPLAAVTAVGVLASTAAHPALPPLAGTLILACRLAAAAGSKVDPALEWLHLHLIGSVPALTLLFGWAAAGGAYRYPLWSMERALMALAGVHACSIGWRRRRQEKRGSAVGVVASMLSVICASFVALCALWGHPYVALYGAAALQAWEFVT